MNSLIISIFFLIVGCFFSINSVPLIKPNSSNINLEPGVFPMFLGILLIIISLFMIVSQVLQIINGKRKSIKTSDNNEAEVSSYAIKDIIVVTISIIVFIIIWQLINFFVGLVILIFALFKLFGMSLKNYIIFTISFSLVIYVVFSLILKLTL